MQERVRLIWIRGLIYPRLSLNIVRETAAYLEAEEVPFVVIRDRVSRWNYGSNTWSTEYVLSQPISVGFNSIAVRTDPGEVIVGCAGGDCKDYRQIERLLGYYEAV